MITKQIGYIMDIAEDGQIQVKTVLHIMEDDVEIATQLPYSRVILPGQSLEGEAPWIQRIAAAAHTPEVVADFLRAQAIRDSEAVG